jgi:hypothetical protein
MMFSGRARCARQLPPARVVAVSRADNSAGTGRGIPSVKTDGQLATVGPVSPCDDGRRTRSG